MKIAVLGTRGFPGIQGGVEVHCEKLYPRLTKLGCEITVFTRRPYVDSQNKTYENINLIPLDCPKSKSFEAIIHTLKGIFQAKKISPDILHIHAVGPSLLIPSRRETVAMPDVRGPSSKDLCRRIIHNPIPTQRPEYGHVVVQGNAVTAIRWRREQPLASRQIDR